MKTAPLTFIAFRTAILLAAVVFNLISAPAADAPPGMQSMMHQLAATVSRLVQAGPSVAGPAEADVSVRDSSTISMLGVLPPPPPPASLVESYFPMHDGDWRTLEATISGHYYSLYETITYDSWDDFFLLAPDESGSFSFRYNNGNLLWYALNLGGITLWFDTPVIFLQGSSLPNGGNWTATTTSSYSGVLITLHASFSVAVAGTVTIPLGTFPDCRKLTVSLTASAQGNTEKLSSEALMLTPGMGYIQEAVLDANYNFKGWANLTSGEVGGIPVDVLSRLDTTPPSLVLTSPKSAQRWSNDWFSVTGTASDNVAVTNVSVQVNNTGWNDATSLNNWATWSSSAHLTPGTNTLQAFATDSSGNVSPISSGKVVYVLSAPLSLVIVGKGTVTGARDGQQFEIGKQVVLKATPAAGYALTNVLVQTNGVTLVSTNRAVSFLMQSNLVVRVTFADVKKPVLTIAAPKSKQRSSNEVFTVTGKVSDNGPVAGVWCQLNTNDWTLATSGNGWTNWGAQVKLVPGPNTLRACAVDMGGNRSLTNTVTFTYVLTAPIAVQITGQGTVTPKNGTMLEIGKLVSAKATAGKGSSLTNWTVQVDGVTLVSTNRAVGFVMRSNLLVRAVFVDVTKPTCAMTAPKTGQRWSNAVFTAKGTAKDNVGVAGVWYQLNANDWALASTSNGWTNWGVDLTLTAGANTVRVYAEDAAGNRSPTNSVSLTYVKMFTLTDYFPLPLGADWLYDGTDLYGNRTKLRFSVTSTNYPITTYRGRSPVISYTTNCVRVSAAYLDWATLVPFDTWEEYMVAGRNYGSFGDDDLPGESLRVAGGFIAPAQMAVGSSFTLKADAYMFGTNVGAASISLQLIENTSLTVPAGNFPDVLHLRWSFAHPGGSQTHDEWWARSVGKIKRLFISGNESAVSYELIQYSVPPALDLDTTISFNDLPATPITSLEFKGGDGSLTVANGLWQMQLSGPVGAVVIIESSPDLVHWLPIQTNTVPAEGLSLSVPISTEPAKFFRARLP